MSRPLFLRAQCSLDLLLKAHPSIAHGLVLRRDELVCSSLSREATLQLHRYLLLAFNAQASASARPLPGEPGRPTSPAPFATARTETLPLHFALHHLRLRAKRAAASAGPGSFAIGSGDAMQGLRGDAVRLPKLYFARQAGSESEGGEAEESEAAVEAAGEDAVEASVEAAKDEAALLDEAVDAGEASDTPASEHADLDGFRLVVFQLHELTAAVLVRDEPAVWTSHAWYPQLGTQLAGELAPLSASLSAEAKSPRLEADAFRYLYLDTLNLALKTSFRSSRGARVALNRSLNSLMVSAHADLKAGQVREVASKTGDGWVLARASGSRELFMVAENKYATLTELHQEVLALSTMHLSHIFLDG